MHITINFADDFYHDNVDNQGFMLDVDINNTISDVKTLISLRYVDLDPDHFKLLFYDKPLNNEMKLLGLLAL